MNASTMTDLDSSEMVLIEGGNFAYDVGRLIRFFGVAGPMGNGFGMAVGDWIATSASNQA